MYNIVCIKHPQYQGTQAPVLSCKVCCAKYISVIKQMQTDKKSAEVEATAETLANAGNSHFHPGSI